MPEVTVDAPPVAAALPRERGARWRLLWRYGFLALLGGGVIAVVVLGAVLVPLVSPFESDGQLLSGRLNGPGFVDAEGLRHLLGTDALGRDVLTRVFVGARFSLFIALLSVLGSAVIGTAVGLVAGYRGGWVDDALMRVVDVQLSFPLVLLALALVALLGPSLTNVVVVFVMTGWPIFARTVRASTLTLKQRTFVEAAHALGSSATRVVLRHILPNAAGPLLVVATFELAKVLIYESSLGFLGLGVQAPTATWGNMMADGRDAIDISWWITFFPGLTLVLTAAAANWLGDGLNQLLDPRARRH